MKWWRQQHWASQDEVEVDGEKDLTFTEEKDGSFTLEVSFSSVYEPPLLAYEAFLKAHGDECSLYASYSESWDGSGMFIDGIPIYNNLLEKMKI